MGWIIILMCVRAAGMAADFARNTAQPGACFEHIIRNLTAVIASRTVMCYFSCRIRYRHYNTRTRKLSSMSIAQRIRDIQQQLPEYVTLVAAAKNCTAAQVREAIDAGISHIGENYLQQAQTLYDELGNDAGKVSWHMIGHLQKNKINKACAIFDTVQTVESFEKAIEIDKRVPKAGRESIDVLIEINSGNELSKSGMPPESNRVRECAQKISSLAHLRLRGLMTMGPFTNDPEQVRPHFKKTKQVFDELARAGYPQTQIDTLSMGMSHSYRVAVQEGSTMVRLGTTIFGPRSYT